jgi:hypothetical protein
MDDAFTYRSTDPIRREVDPRLVRAGVALLVLLIVVVAFARWVIASERRSFAPPAPVGAARVASEPAADVVVDPTLTAADARQGIRAALAAARVALLTDGSFLAATPARLTELQPGYTYVDGPSTTPHVVSVASSGHAWAAAALSPDGGCLWIHATAAGEVTSGSGTACTGAAALMPAARG